MKTMKRSIEESLIILKDLKRIIKEIELRDQNREKGVSMSEELKPCPFCNAEITMGNIRSIENYNTADVNSFHVMCNSCLCETQHFDSEQEAIEAWNKRAIPEGYVRIGDVIKLINKYAPTRRGIRGQEISAEDIYEPIFIRMKKEIKKLEGK